MAKKRVNERVVIFLKDYTNKKEGVEMKCDVALANHLIMIGVAELSNNKDVEILKPIENKKPIKKNKKQS